MKEQAERLITPAIDSDLAERASRIRRLIVRMSAAANSSHIGSALSAVDLLTVLYFGILNVDPAQPQAPWRDRFILSKGHGGMAIYATLAERGFFGHDRLDTFYRDGSTLAGHSDFHAGPGIEVSTGSLGHGLSLGLGMALAAKHDRLDYRTFVLLSDGECDEGSVWEAALAAAQFQADNLIGIVDYNKIQSFGRVEEVMNLEPLADKWRAFGWETREIDGHNLGEIEAALRAVPFLPGKPSMIIAHTVKGKGVSFMEDRLEWHYKSPNPEQLARALVELGGNEA